MKNLEKRLIYCRLLLIFLVVEFVEYFFINIIKLCRSVLDFFLVKHGSSPESHYVFFKNCLNLWTGEWRICKPEEIKGIHWWDPDQYGWWFCEHRELPEFVPTRGYQRIWTWHVPEGILL